MTRLLKLAAACGLLFSSVGCCCLSGGGYGACYPPANSCPGGNCGIGAVPGPGVAQATTFSPTAYNDHDRRPRGGRPRRFPAR